MLALTLVAFATLTPLASAHGFIKQVTVNGQTSQAQKTNIKQSSFRAVSDNTGWIGSDFFNSDCAICGCSNTPFNTVASPGGNNFADASQSAGQTPSTAAGSTVTLHVAGNPGQGWPHPNGHLQAYLAECPASGCTNFDVRGADWFKIQGIKDGVPPLRAAYDRGADSNPWPIEIPKAVKSASYIMRAEIWAYGQSSSAEGGQVQMYPFCMNVQVTGGGAANPATVSIPSIYANDKQIEAQGQSYLPGPAINELFGGSGTGTGGATSPAPASSPSPSPASSPSPPSSASNTGSNTGSSSNGNTGSGIQKSSKSGRKCKAGTSTQRKRRSQHRRHHHRNQRHAS